MINLERWKFWLLFGLLIVFQAIAFVAIQRFFGLPTWTHTLAALVFGGLLGYFMLPSWRH